jgi:hypothetical protein
MASMLLEGWKQIIYHLHVSQATARQWELHHRMPVQHCPAGRVYAESDELDAWKLTQSAPAPVPIRRCVITVRVTEDMLTSLRPLIGQRFRTMQEFASRAVAHYAEQQLRAPVLSR